MFFGKFKDDEHYGFGVFEERFESYKEIDDNEHMAMIDEANSKGKLIDADEEGNPILVDPPPPTEEEVNKQRLNELESYLTETDWYAIRYADTGVEIPAEIKTKRQQAREEISQIRESLEE